MFLVHGIGEQKRAETAAMLRSGFEEALEAIREWQRAKNVLPDPYDDAENIPPPFVFEGYWCNYADLEKTFPEDWRSFNERERWFYGYLWKRRALSVTRTYAWIIKRQLGLLDFRVLKEVGLRAWLLYLPLQIVSFAALTFALIRHPRLVTGSLADIRLYLDPKGLVERAIVQRIDERVEAAFCRMIGLGPDFRLLRKEDLIETSGERMAFDRVVWVAHSVGTLISYNVLSDLFRRAAKLERNGDPEQKAGVARFRKTLRRFVTLGSPLDKAAFLFGERSLRPWPKGVRTAFLQGGERFEKNQPPEAREWWINFYHVLDPVSGSLEHTLICGEKPPASFHIYSGWIPGWAHVAYWSDMRTLRFILSRIYGKDYLPDRELVPWPPQVLGALALGTYLVWAAALIVAAYALITWMPQLAELTLAKLKIALGF